jgi:hypothetical protein
MSVRRSTTRFRSRALRAVVAVLLVFPVLALTSSPAFARGDGWQPVEIGAVDLPACGATMHFEFPVNKEFARAVTKGGVQVMQVTGSLFLTITNPEVEPPRSVTVNISGPSFSPTSEPVASSRGRTIVFLSPEDAATYGLPEMFVVAGYFRVRFEAGHTIIEKFSGTVAIDLCAALT